MATQDILADIYVLPGPDTRARAVQARQKPSDAKTDWKTVCDSVVMMI